MRDVLTIIACALVVALTAALVGPYVVDWTAQRALVDARLSQALGARVAVGGAIRITLLPTPSLSVGDVSVASDAPDGASLTARKIDFELAVAPLMRGDLQFMLADVDHPVLRLTQRADGAVPLPVAPSALPQQTNFDQVRVRDGALIVTRPGAAPLSLRDVDLDAKASSLVGPFHASGSVGRGAKAVRFQLDTDTRHGDVLPVQASLSGLRVLATLSLDGNLTFAPAAGATKIAYAGSLSASGAAKLEDFASTPWTLSGDLRVDAGGVSLAKGALSLGSGERAIEATATGKAAFAKGAPITAALDADQVDLDRFVAGFGKQGGARLLAALDDAWGDPSLFSPAPPLRLSFATPALTLGGATLTGTKIAFALDGAGPARLSVRSLGPGDSHLDWDGALETGPAAVLRGRLDVGAEETDQLAAWLAPVFPQAAARLKAAPFGMLAAAANVELSGAGVSARQLVLTADRTVLRGAAAYTRAIGGQRARLYANLRSEALDLDGLPDLTGPAQSAQGMDLALSLDARAVRLAHFGQGVVDAGRIVLSLTRTGPDLRLEKLSLADLGGANLSATGWANDHGARLDATLDATRLDELAALARRVAPGPVADAFVARAVALSPARLTLSAQAVRGQGGLYRPVSLSLQGSARGTQASGSLQPNAADPRAVDLAVDLRGPDASILLRQLGVETLPLADSGPGRIRLRAHGRLSGALTASFDASLAGSNVAFKGEVANWRAAPEARGVVSVKSADAAPLLRLMTVILPDPTQSVPMAVTAEADAKPDSLALTQIAGSVAGARVAGAAALAEANGAPQLTGALALDRLSLMSLASLSLGPLPPARSGALWSKAKLSPGLAAPPATRLTLSADRFDLAPGLSGSAASFGLRLGPDLVALDNMRMTLEGGALTGSLAFRRDGGAASISADLKARDLRFEASYLSARLSGAAQFAATGASARDLVDGLAGSGSLQASDLSAPGADPGALARVVAASDADGFRLDAPSVEALLASELDKGPLAAPGCAFDLTAAGGVMQLTGATLAPTPATRARVTLALDLRDLSISQRVRLAAAVAPKDWPDKTPPTVDVVWTKAGPRAAPVRAIEADSLIGDFSARAAAREAARIEALDFDIRERAFFERRLKGLEFMHRREKEVQEWKAEQAARAQAAAAAQASAQPAPKPPTGAPTVAPRNAPSGIVADPLSLGRF